MANTVWILGSGFSKSLGGPLLNDLLSDRSGGESRQRLKNSIFDSDIDALFSDDERSAEPRPDYGWVYQLFSEHLRGSDHSRGKGVYWDHAEEFLTFIDSTATAAGRRELLREWLPADHNSDADIQLFRRHAVEAVASECQFVDADMLNTDEAWEPYLEWAGRLNPSTDAIVTFNYDLVLEHMRREKRVSLIDSSGILTPRKLNANPSRIPVYKLHGSVNWFINDHGEISESSDFVSAVNAGLRPLLGTPGITKRGVRERYLQAIWERAGETLRQAEVIVFLGYRSPPSDPDARAFILNLISAPEGERGAPRHRRVHLVLGPNTDDGAVTRLEKLIEFAMVSSGHARRYAVGFSPHHPRYEVIRQPLYVEDFLSVYHEKELYGTDPEEDWRQGTSTHNRRASSQ